MAELSGVAVCQGSRQAREWMPERWRRMFRREEALAHDGASARHAAENRRVKVSEKCERRWIPPFWRALSSGAEPSHPSYWQHSRWATPPCESEGGHRAEESENHPANAMLWERRDASWPCST